MTELALPRMRVAINVDDQAGSHVAQWDITIRHADQLRAELEAGQYGIRREHAFHLADLWAWAACVRLGLFTGKFKEFQSRIVDIVKQDDELVIALEPVDPTRPADGSNSASTSVATSPEPATSSGSAPTTD